MADERPHEHHQKLQQFKQLGTFVGDANYTKLVFPDGELDLQHSAIDMDSAEFIRDALIKNKHITSVKYVLSSIGAWAL